MPELRAQHWQVSNSIDCVAENLPSRRRIYFTVLNYHNASERQAGMLCPEPCRTRHECDCLLGGRVYRQDRRRRPGQMLPNSLQILTLPPAFPSCSGLRRDGMRRRSTRLSPTWTITRSRNRERPNSGWRGRCDGCGQNPWPHHRSPADRGGAASTGTGAGY
jgi:hypothetical protein